MKKIRILVQSKWNSWGYNEYPQDSSAVYKKLFYEAQRHKCNKLLLIERRDNLLHYVYVVKLADGGRIGIGLAHDRICKDFNLLLNFFDKLLQDLATEEFFIKKSKELYFLLYTNIGKRDYARVRLDIFLQEKDGEIDDAFVDAIPVPQASLAVARNLTVVESLNRKKSEWFIERLKGGYHNVYIYLQEGVTLPMSHSFRGSLNKVTKIFKKGLLRVWTYFIVSFFGILLIIAKEETEELIREHDNKKGIVQDSIMTDSVSDSKGKDTKVSISVESDSNLRKTEQSECDIAVSKQKQKPETIKRKAGSDIKTTVPTFGSDFTPDNFVHVEAGVCRKVHVLKTAKNRKEVEQAKRDGRDIRNEEKGIYETEVDFDMESFYIAKYELTQKEYEVVMGENPSTTKGENLPVTNISWLDAIKYCNERSKKEGFDGFYEIKGENVKFNPKGNGYRLPFELEWTYAAFSGPKNIRHAYIGGDTLGRVAWFLGNSKGKLHEVGKKRANNLGLHDMNGNVAEYVYDKDMDMDMLCLGGSYNYWIGFGYGRNANEAGIYQPNEKGVRIAFNPKGSKNPNYEEKKDERNVIGDWPSQNGLKEK